MRLACSAGNMDLLVEIRVGRGVGELDKSIKMAEIVFIQCSCHPDKNIRFFGVFFFNIVLVDTMKVIDDFRQRRKFQDRITFFQSCNRDEEDNSKRLIDEIPKRIYKEHICRACLRFYWVTVFSQVPVFEHSFKPKASSSSPFKELCRKNFLFRMSTHQFELVSE